MTEESNKKEKEIKRESGMGYYDKRLCWLMFFSSIPNALVSLQVLVTQFTPNYHCDVTEVVENFEKRNESNALDRALNVSIPWEEDEHGKMSLSKCHQYNLTQWTGNYSHRPENISIIPCKSFYFEGPEVSAISEFGLVCDRDWLKPYFTSFVFIGMIVGCLVAGTASDMFGRKPVFLVFTFWSFLAVFALSFAQDEISYAIFCVLAGIGNLVNYAIASVIGSEIIPPKHRTFLYFALSVGYAVGYMCAAPMSYLFRDWRWFLRFSGAIGILYIPYFWYIDESPRWLLVSGKEQKAQAILEKIAKLNKREPVNVKDLQESVSETPLGVLATLKKIGREPVLIVRFAVFCINWFIISMAYFALALGNNNLGGNRFLNLFYASLVEIASAFLYYVFVAKMGRCIPFIACSVCLAFSIAGANLFANSNPTMEVVLTMCGKLMVATAWAIAYIHALEIFPTKARQSIMFWVVVASRIGGVLSPFIVHAGESGSAFTASLVTAGLVLTSSLLYFLLPEMGHTSLPQTVEEAKSLQGIWKQYWDKLFNNHKDIPGKATYVRGLNSAELTI